MSNAAGNGDKGKGLDPSTILPVVGTILAAVIPISLPTFSDQIFNRPDINVVVTPNVDGDSQKALLTLTNHGRASATDLSLTIETPKKITNITNLFSSDDIQLINSNASLQMHEPTSIDQSFLKLRIPKLAPGDGSMVKLEMLMKDIQQDQTYYNYTVAAVYDQGSTMGEVLKTPPPATAGQILVSFANYIAENSIVLAIEFALIPVAYFVLRWLSRKYYKRRLISEILNDLWQMRFTFRQESDPSTYEPNDEYWTLKRFLDRFEDELDIDERILLHDLNIQLFIQTLVGSESERLKSRKELQGEKLQLLLSHNRKTLALIEKALREVDWAKYRKS